MGDSMMMSMFSPKAVITTPTKINFKGWG